VAFTGGASDYLAPSSAMSASSRPIPVIVQRAWGQPIRQHETDFLTGILDHRQIGRQPSEVGSRQVLTAGGRLAGDDHGRPMPTAATR